MKSSIITLSLFLTLAFGLNEPNGKYCGNVIGNEIDITFYSNKDTSDITATIFGSHYQCDNEKYSYNADNKEIDMSSDPNDCLNKVLEKYDLCPCPPNIKYDDTDNIIDVYTNLGDVSMKSC